MLAKGVEGVMAFAVDNVAVRPCDPVFVGFCRENKADLGSKVCGKTHAHEKVGVICRKDNMESGCCVVEYSEMDKATAELKNASGELVFGAGNICIHYFSMEFLATKCSPAALPKVYHIARKAIPYADEETGQSIIPKGRNTGIKLESFIFDVFPASTAPSLMEVIREEEFAPVKNAPGSAEDSPDTARALLLQLHRSWLCAAGAVIKGDGPCEVSPLVSYSGENLESLKGVEMETPCIVLAAGETVPAGLAAGTRTYTV